MKQHSISNSKATTAITTTKPTSVPPPINRSARPPRGQGLPGLPGARRQTRPPRLARLRRPPGRRRAEGEARSGGTRGEGGGQGRPGNAGTQGDPRAARTQGGGVSMFVRTVQSFLAITLFFGPFFYLNKDLVAANQISKLLNKIVCFFKCLSRFNI